jgi:hypothetical protein
VKKAICAFLSFAAVCTGTGVHAQSPPAAFVKIDHFPAIDGDPRDWAGITAERLLTTAAPTTPAEI